MKSWIWYISICIIDDNLTLERKRGRGICFLYLKHHETWNIETYPDSADGDQSQQNTLRRRRSLWRRLRGSNAYCYQHHGNTEDNTTSGLVKSISLFLYIPTSNYIVYHMFRSMKPRLTWKLFSLLINQTEAWSPTNLWFTLWGKRVSILLRW